VVDRSPLPFQFSGYRQHCAVPDLSLLGIPFQPFPLDSFARLDFFVVIVFPLLLFHQNPVYKPSAFFFLFLLVVLPS
jgi:hypothetical protein